MDHRVSRHGPSGNAKFEPPIFDRDVDVKKVDLQAIHLHIEGCEEVQAIDVR